MASSVMHMVIANELNKKINRDLSKLLIGTIAPDISKLIGDTKIKSHFLNNDNTSVPDLNMFLDKYRNYLEDDFVMGYYIHLYTDYLWFKYFIDNIDYSSVITTVDGNRVLCDRETFEKYLYNDYTNLNINLIDKYNLDLKIFYNEIPNIKNIIEEIPMDKLNIIVDRTGIIITNTKENKSFLFDIENIDKFIKLATELISSEIEKL